MTDGIYKERRWGMVIDLDLCTGCQACVVACHAENNVPAVGDVEVTLNRWLHWIFIERMWVGEQPHARASFRPLLCQHCMNAPCEPVCPVYAPTHDRTDNINTQVYNRCIGVRYCGVNCPYRVRVFNWWNPYFPPPLNEQLNPDVTVRKRGVMEKCTFCIQRIQRGRQEARVNGVELNPDDVQPACVQTCPTGALMWGDLYDPNSPLHQLTGSARGYLLLDELNTFPAITYLERGETNVG